MIRKSKFRNSLSAFNSQCNTVVAENVLTVMYYVIFNFSYNAIYPESLETLPVMLDEQYYAIRK